MDSVKIVFKRSADEELALELFSHYTCIIGKDSGEGKSEFYSIIEEGITTGELAVEADLPFTLATATSLEALLNVPDRMIIMIDEYAMIRNELIQKVNKSKHLFIAISRAFPLKSDYPLKGIYNLSRDDSGWFSIQKANGLPVGNTISDCNYLLTEARDGRGENELIRAYANSKLKITGAGGRDKIEKFLRNTNEPVLVLVDLGAIGRAYDLLQKRCKQNPKIVFYDYESFEQLLCHCDLVKELDKNFDKDVFDFVSIERFYEKKVETLTAGTEIAYEHGKILPEKYLKNKDLVLANKIGNGLLCFLDGFDKKGNTREIKGMLIF